jgi:uncharacterized membrane protein
MSVITQRSGVFRGAKSGLAVQARATHPSTTGWVRINADMLAIWAVTALLGLLNIFGVPSGFGPFRLGLTLLVVFLLPGYAVCTLLFGRRDQINWAERLGLSIVFSVAAVVFLGLGLYFAQIPITGDTLLLGLVLVLVVVPTAAVVCRMRLPQGERFAPLAFRGVPTSGSLGHKLTFAGAILLIVTYLGAIGYTSFYRSPGEHYTEFSVLNPQNGKADMPITVSKGGMYSLVAQITNRESKSQSYRLRVSTDGHAIQEIQVWSLDNGAKWAQQLQVPLPDTQAEHNLRLELFVPGESKPYRELHLWINNQ